MLPPPLAPPLPTPVPRRSIPWLGVVGVALVLIGILGGIVWFGALSPFGFVRIRFVTAAERTIDVARPGTYLVFEEGPGATAADLPPRLSITVLDESGRSVPVETLVAPGERAAPQAYHVPPNEGRAIARFDASRDGSYYVRVAQLDLRNAGDPDGYRADLPRTIAVGRELSWPWMRSPLGLLVLGVLPMLVGVALLARERRRRRARRDKQPWISESPLEPVR